jgi:hypothetical protein
MRRISSSDNASASPVIYRRLKASLPAVEEGRKSLSIPSESSDEAAERQALLDSAGISMAEQGDGRVTDLIGAGQFEAASLRLSESQVEAARGWSKARLYAGQNYPALANWSIPVVRDYIQVLEVRDRGVKAEGDINSRYLAFHNALNELLVKIQALVGTESSGDKMDIPAKKIFNEIFEFMFAHAGDRIGGPYPSQDAAEKAAEQFKQGTVEVSAFNPHRGYLLFYLVPSYAALNALVPCLVGENKRDDMLYVLKEYREKRISDPDGVWAGDVPIDPSYLENLEQALVISGRASQLQAVQLALEDVRKIHETETQFCLETYNRQLTQFNNLVKMFSAFMESLVQNLKSFL